MVNYLCRTCFFISECGTFFKNLGQLKYILDLLLPQIRGSFQVNTLVCSTCYNFLRNIERFRIACLQTDLKIRDREVVTAIQNQPTGGLLLPSAGGALGVNSSALPDVEADADGPVSAILRDGAPGDRDGPSPDPKRPKRTRPEGDSEVLILNDLNDPNSNLVYQQTLKKVKAPVYDIKMKISNVSGNVKMEKAEEGPKGATGAPLLSAEVITLDSSDEEEDARRGPVPPPKREPKPEVKSESEGGEGRRGAPKSVICPSELVELRKKRKDDKDNASEYPGFLERRSADGQYQCQLCERRYKTAKGLYSHSKLKHREQLRFHRCGSCAFFTLWAAALARHAAMFHGGAAPAGCAEGAPSSPAAPLRCPHCTFRTESRDEIDEHVPICSNALDSRFARKKHKRDASHGHEDDDDDEDDPPEA